MASGWGKDGTEQLEVQAVLDAAVLHARAQINKGVPSLLFCLDCNTEIPAKRREALPGVKYCLTCQTEHDNIFKRQARNCWHRSMR